MKVIFLFLFLFYVGITYAQDVSKSTTKWNVTNLKDLNTQEQQTYYCQFITYGSDKIDWIQGNGSILQSYRVSQTSGIWLDANSLGKIQYTFADKSTSRGTLLIEKTTVGWTINLILLGGTSDYSFQYLVSSIEKL